MKKSLFFGMVIRHKSNDDILNRDIHFKWTKSTNSDRKHSIKPIKKLKSYFPLVLKQAKDWPLVIPYFPCMRRFPHKGETSNYLPPDFYHITSSLYLNRGFLKQIDIFK